MCYKNPPVMHNIAKFDVYQGIAKFYCESITIVMNISHCVNRDLVLKQIYVTMHTNLILSFNTSVLSFIISF